MAIYNITLQISDPDMIELLRKKLRLHAPYAGAFLKKMERYTFSSYCMVILLCCKCCSEDEVVNSLDDIYNVGTFVQITEMAEQGNKIRMIIQGIRRFAWHTDIEYFLW